MSFDDELLLTTLGGALETRSAAPSSAEFDEFLDVVAASGGGPFPRADAPRARPARTLLAAAASVVALVALAMAGVLATGSPFPNSLRTPVRALGVPIDDAAVARTRSGMADLRAALGGTDETKVRVTALALAARLLALRPTDRAVVDTEARELIRRADARLFAAPAVERMPNPTPVDVSVVAPEAPDPVAGTSTANPVDVSALAPEAPVPAAEETDVPSASGSAAGDGQSFEMPERAESPEAPEAPESSE